MTENIEVRSNRQGLNNIGFGLLVALYLVSFFSKAGVNLFGILVYLIALIKIGLDDRMVLRREPLLIFLLLPLVYGAVASLFSLPGGWPGLTDFLNNFKFFFLPFAFAILLHDTRRIEWLFVASLISAVIVIIYGFSHEEQRAFGMFHGYFIYPDVRTAQMMMIVSVACFVFIDDKGFRAKYPGTALILALLTPVFMFSLYMGSIRSAWLGFYLAIALYAILFNRNWLIPLILIVVIASIYGQNSFMSKELLSILDFDQNRSNSTRFHLWSTGWDFWLSHFWFGVGGENIQQRFLNFYNSHPESYKETYHFASNSYGGFHNSYLQILIERGILFLIVLIICGLVLIYKLAWVVKTTSHQSTVFIRAYLTVSVAYLFSQFFHNELLSYSATLYLLLMYSAIYSASKLNNEH